MLFNLLASSSPPRLLERLASFYSCSGIKHFNILPFLTPSIKYGMYFTRVGGDWYAWATHESR